MSNREQAEQRERYVKAWRAIAGEQAAVFTDLTIEEIGAAREARARRAAFLGDVAAEHAKKLGRSKTKRRR